MPSATPHGIPIEKVQLAVAIELLRVLYSLVYSFPAIPRKIHNFKQNWIIAKTHSGIRKAICTLLQESPVIRAHCPGEVKFDDLVTPPLFNARFGLQLSKAATPPGVLGLFEQILLYIRAVDEWTATKVATGSSATPVEGEISHTDLIARYERIGLLPPTGQGSRCDIQDDIKSAEDRTGAEIYGFVTSQIFRFLQPVYASNLPYFGIAEHLVRPPVG